jgi:hypothetical protein
MTRCCTLWARLAFARSGPPPLPHSSLLETPCDAFEIAQYLWERWIGVEGADLAGTESRSYEPGWGSFFDSLEAS